MTRALTYREALEELSRALRFGIHPSLDGIRALSGALGHPERAYDCVQVTGTNGKTSVTRLVSAILHGHGLRVGTYTSPHLVSYTERFVVDGTPIAEDDFAAAFSRVLDARAAAGLGVDAVTEFELLTATALEAFRTAEVDRAVLEVGMGGRWDATSVVSPSVAVITGVALDHTDRLGTTREEIAADKAHIVKPGAAAVIGPGCAGVDAIIAARAAESGSPVVRVGLPDADVAWSVSAVPDAPGGFTRLSVDGALAPYPDLAVRAPSYQAPNVAVAIAAAEAALGMPLFPDVLRDVLLRMTFPGRFELLSEQPPLIIDGAHNPEAALVLASAIRDAFGDRKPVVLLGVMADKDAEGIVAALAPVAAGFVCTASRSDRALSPRALADVVREAGAAVLGVADTVEAGISVALDHGAHGVVAAGSIYVAGEVDALRHGAAS